MTVLSLLVNRKLMILETAFVRLESLTYLIFSASLCELCGKLCLIAATPRWGIVMRLFTFGFYCCLLFLFALTANAADWPMWRHDVARSGATSEKLPDEVHLQWSREMPAAKVAWPNEPRLQFDAVNESVVVGKTLFVGSSYDGSLRAFDTETGEAKWTFYTEGPIRCAPVAWKNKVAVGSDDGYLYCLNAATGEKLWKVRGAAVERPDYRQLGNARLISYWPVRGGAVLKEGTIYFGAGIWPSMGVFINAVDAETGKVKWRNSEVNYIEQVRIDHNYLSEAGLSPQGYFLFADGKLQVPNGRSMPAGFNPVTGKLVQYVQGYRNGDSRVTAGGRFLFVGEAGVVNSEDGREVGDRWKSAGKEAPKSWSTPKRDLFEGPFWGYKFMPGLNYRSVFDNGISYGMQGEFLYAYNLNKTETSLYDKKVGETTYHPAKWEAEKLWDRFYVDGKKGAASKCAIKAGNRLYTHVNKLLVAIELSSADKPKPKLAWKKELDGIPAGMIAADGKLFVTLTDGRLLCFGKKSTSVKKHSLPSAELAKQNSVISERVTHLLERTKVDDGYAVVLGFDQAGFVEELLARSKLHLIVVEKDHNKVNALRQRLADAKLYGTRAEVFVGDPETFLFPPYLASLMIYQSADDAKSISEETLAHLYEILRPYGGTLWLQDAAKQVDQLKQQVKKQKLANATVLQESESALIRKVGPLPGSADWTHEGGDAGRTYFSRDDLVKAPLGILWYGDGPDHGFYKHKDYGRGVKPHVAGGRMFAFDDIRQLLSGVDAYTGRLLWNFKTETPYVRYVSLPDGVFVGRNLQCDLLDPTTGEIEKTYHCLLDQKPGEVWGVVDVRVTPSHLFVALGKDLPPGHSHPAIESGLWDCEALFAFDRKSGNQLWAKYPKHRYNIHAIAMGGGMVFVTDSMAPLEADKLKRRGSLPDDLPSITYAFDAATGEKKWEYTATYDFKAMTGRGPLAIRPYDDWISFSQNKQIVLFGKLYQAIAIEAAGGKKLWENRAGLQPIIVREETFINQAGNRYNLLTGELVDKSRLFTRSGGCNYTVGNKHLLFLRNKCASYVDIDSKKEYSLRNLRSGCSNSLVAADGLLNVPCFSTGCVCNYPLQTSFAMKQMPESEKWAGEKAFQLIKPKK